MENDLIDLIRSRHAGPFLFVGSGFSRRYVGLEDWQGLLSRFCLAGKPFEYYLSTADGSVPKAAYLLAKDFNSHWWSSSDFATSVERDKSKIVDSTSALRIEISRHLSTLDQSIAKSSEYAEEFELLAGLNVDGIITTNWDLLLEQIFPGYKTYIGQRELVFSNTHGIGEIYKIHGCSTKPSTLVMTDEDYRAFNERNAYLAAKLITIFVEHPVVFIGYSLSDQNVSSLLRAISLCVGPEHLDKLRRNLIFVQRLSTGDTEGMSDTYITIDGVQIPLVLVKTNDFRPLYRALADIKRKIPVRILRYCKEQLYELVASTEPQDRLCVVDIDEIDRSKDLEFVVGVGVATRESGKEMTAVGEVGYATIEADDLFRDLLHDDGNYNPTSTIENVISRAGKNTKNIPVFKYLHAPERVNEFETPASRVY